MNKLYIFFALTSGLNLFAMDITRLQEIYEEDMGKRECENWSTERYDEILKELLTNENFRNKFVYGDFQNTLTIYEHFLPILWNLPSFKALGPDASLRNAHFFAALGCKWQIARVLYNYGLIEIDAKFGKSGFSLIHIAAKWNNAEAMEWLIKNKANFNGKSTFGQKTPLHLVVAKRRTDDTCLKLLLKQDSIDLTAVDKKLRTALHRAVEAKYVAGVRDILSKAPAGIILWEDDSAQTPLFKAGNLSVSRRRQRSKNLSNKDRIMKLLNEKLESENITATVPEILAMEIDLSEDEDPTSLPSEPEKIPTINNINTNHQPRNQVTVNIFNIYSGQADQRDLLPGHTYSRNTIPRQAPVVSWLDYLRANMDTDADPVQIMQRLPQNYLASFIHTPLDIEDRFYRHYLPALFQLGIDDTNWLIFEAAAHENWQLVCIALEVFGISYGFINAEGKSLFELACAANNLHWLQLDHIIIASRADIRQRFTTNRSTCLHWAAIKADPDIFLFLIEQAPDLMSVQDDWGSTPLHYAISRNRTLIVAQLLEMNYQNYHQQHPFLDIRQIKDIHDITPLDLFVEMKNNNKIVPEIVALFERDSRRD